MTRSLSPRRQICAAFDRFARAERSNVAQIWGARATGLVLGFAADRVLGDPARFHPVAGFGQVAATLERVTYRDARAAGALHVGVLVGGAAGLGAVLQRSAGRRGPWADVGLTAVATWAVLGGRSLEREASALHRLLADDDLAGARRRVTHLVGRDPSTLDADGVARATVESVAENTSDAVVAPLVAGAVAGVPGLLAYRAANTLDAMVGHRTPRLERFGWAAARLDDLLNLVPARLSALLAALLAPVVGGRGVDAVRVWRRDARHHPSPNAGPVEAAFAGALGVRLGGVNVYAGRTEDRHVLGDGPGPSPADVGRAARLAWAVDVGALAVSALVASRPRRRPRRRR